MRASTLFALTLAVIVGLGVATAAKFAGFFGTPPAAPVVAAKKAETQVLVAARSLFAGDLIDAAYVKIRPLRPDEVDAYNQSKDNYLPPVAQAVALRVAAKNIYADEPILKDSLKDLAKPEPLNARLLANMRAVNLSLPKDRCAGGQIRVGDWVDVFLTSDIEGNGIKALRTACIAPKVRVVAKRNTLWPIFAPLPDNKPVDFTVEVNTYRAGLLESVRSKGDITLAALGASEQRLLETQRERLLQGPSGVQPSTHFLPPDSPEASEEDARVAAMSKGEQPVTEADLVRIFGLRVQTPPPPLATINVERVYGTQRGEPIVFSTTGALMSDNAKRSGAPVHNASRPSPQVSSGFSFHIPDCPTCGTNSNKGKKK